MPDLVYPSAEAVEQASSSITAGYKADLIGGNTVIDMTGGLGVDAFFMSRVAREVIYVEKNSDLAEAARYNFQKLGVSNIRVINRDSTSFVKELSHKAHTIYADPSRRTDSGRVFRPEDSEPDITGIFDVLIEKADRVIFKLSPLVDIRYLLDRFGSISEVHVVSVNNECKEILLVAEKSGPENEPEIIASDIIGDQVIYFRSRLSEENQEYELGEPGKFIYDPNNAIRKAGLFNTVGRRYGLVKLAKNSHLYSSDVLIDQFPGRKFEVQEVLGYHEFLKLKFRDKAHIATRNFPHSVAELRKRTGIGEGGDRYIFATSGQSGSPFILVTRKI